MKDWDIKTAFRRWLEVVGLKPQRAPLKPAPKRTWYVRPTAYPSAHRVDTYAAKQRRQARRRHGKPMFKYRKATA